MSSIQHMMQGRRFIHGRLIRRLSPLVGLLVCASAGAQEPSAQEASTPGTAGVKAPPPGASAESTPTLVGSSAERLELRGRVMVLAQHADRRLDTGSATEVDERSFRTFLDNARVDVRARVRQGVSLQIEADFAGARPSIKDGFVQARGKRWLLRAGRFKMPLSAFTLESPWTLPRSERGPLDDLLSDHMLLSGRQEGAMVRVEGGGFWDPSLSLGAFTTVVLGEAKDLTSVARFATTPGGHELALVGIRRAALVGVPRAFYAGGLDYTADFEDPSGLALRLWGEARVGQSWFRQGTVVDPATAPATTFFAGRAMAALRHGGAARDDKYAEVALSAGYLDPDRLVIQDHFLELGLAINVGHWQRTRITFEVVHARSGRNLPDPLYRDFALPTVVRQTTATLMLGAAF